MVKRLVGYATTDSNGVAVLEYVGKGVGEMDIVAETGGEILFHHSGTDTNETNPFYYNSNNIQVSTDSTGTLLTNSESTTYNYYANLGSTGDLYDFQAPYIIEFDVVSYSATYCGIQNTETGQTGALRNFSQLTNKTSFHIKITVDGSKIIYQIDDDTPIEQTYSTSKVRVSLTLNNGTLRYKNFFIYRGSSSLVSEPKTIMDCKWYDLGTDSTNSMFDSSSTMTVTYGNEYCSLTETTSGTTGVVVTDASHYIQPNDIFEFDFLQVDGSRVYATMYIRNKANGVSYVTIPHLYDSGKQVNTWIHYKCQIVGDKIYIYIDGSTTPIEKTMSGTDTDYRLYFNTPTDITETRFKNFKVYYG